jgi:hypothetical protein
MLLYSNTYNYSQPNAAPVQGSQNPFEYYSDPNANSYVYISLEQLIGNFMANNVGDHLVLNNVTRYQVIYQFKQALKQFTFDALNEVRAIELELGDTLQITLPPDYVNYVRISWLNRQTGEFHPLSVNRNVNPFVQGYLQDHNWNILFDNDGYPLEGTSLTETVNDSLPNTSENYNQYSLACGGGCVTCNCGRPNVWNFDTTKNYNGTFNIDNRNKKIRFSSDNLSRAIILEYISDGLEYADSDDVKINKLAETALIATVYAELLEMQLGIPEYAKQSARKKANTLFRNAKIKCANIKIPQIAEIMRGRKKWIN